MSIGCNDVDPVAMSQMSPTFPSLTPFRPRGRPQNDPWLGLPGLELNHTCVKGGERHDAFETSGWTLAITGAALLVVVVEGAVA